MAESTPTPLDFSLALARLGLDQYESRLRENGFEDWDDMTDIQESDMTALGFKIGHRRKLQRAIRELSCSSAFQTDYGTSNLFSSVGPSTTGEQSDTTSQSSRQAVRPTRQYRRHPKADPNTPQKPKTAYVLFGEQVRQEPALSHLSFVEIAREVGKRWRELISEERTNTWELPAADKLKGYKEEIERYKQTDDYQNYQLYLEAFKQGRQDTQSMMPSDNKAFSVSEPSPSTQQPPTQDQIGHEATTQDNFDTEMTYEEPTKDTASPVEVGLDEVRRILRALGVNSNLIRVAAFPPEKLTVKAVESFLYGTGSLLYFWSQDEALDLIRSVYGAQNDSTSAHTTEVFAMSAVGSYCDAEAPIVFPQEKFLHFFLHMLSSSHDMGDLRCMRLFACLAICRFTDSVESARILMLAALDIGRNAFTSRFLGTDPSGEEARYWWSVFRSIIFLESWFAYNTSHESRVTSEDLNLFHTHSYTGHGPEALQEHVGELGQLAAYISLDLKTANQPKVAQAKLHFESLDDWHRSLPPPMQLSHLSLADPLSMNWHSKRSLLQLHVLFLGLIIEPYRQCLLDIGLFRLNNDSIDVEDLSTLKNVEEQCVLAARQSARVIALLQLDDLIRSRCWVSVYTSFTGCAILLFSASQKLLELFGEEIGQDLAYASSHLNVLSLCSYENATARMLYIPLQIIFNDIREVLVSPVYRAMRESQIAVKDPVNVAPGHYDAVEGAEDISKNILDLTRRVMRVLQESLNL